MTAFNADGNVSSVTALNGSTGSQTTAYTYGTTLDDSDIASSLLKVADVLPDSVGGSDQVSFAYNRQGEVIQTTDQNGTVHQLAFDKLGRQIHDCVTTVGTGIDDMVLRLSTNYEVRGMKSELASWNNASVTSGDVVNDCQFVFNEFGQLETEYQEHYGEVNTSTTPSIQYAFADGSANTIRPTGITYPNGRAQSYLFSSSGSMPDALSRIDSIQDDDSTVLAQYDYLGQSTFVNTDYTQPSIQWTMINLAGTNDPVTGDIYSGFDLFGRVKDNRWYNYGTDTDVDRILYGYDPNGNRLFRQNTVATANGAYFDELYTNDLIDRLSRMDRGQLTEMQNAITNNTFAQCWTLDATGNWAGFREDDTGDGTWDLNQTRTANTVNEITGISESAGPTWVTPEYDAAGNITTMPSGADPTIAQNCIYDAWSRLVSVSQTETPIRTYIYDAAKRRVIEETYTSGVLSETRHLYYTQPSKWQVIEERVGTSPDLGTAERQFVWGVRYIDDLVDRDRDTSGDGILNERLFAAQDANWNISAITDSTGELQERYGYSAYGVPVFLTSTFVPLTESSVDWETLYAGYRWQQATGVLHVRNRTLHSMLGTWLQRDPLGTTAGSNLYEYANTRPIGVTDQLGLIGPLAGVLAGPQLAACLAIPACAVLLALGATVGVIALALTLISGGVLVGEEVGRICRRRTRRRCNHPDVCNGSMEPMSPALGFLLSSCDPSMYFISSCTVINYEPQRSCNPSGNGVVYHCRITDINGVTLPNYQVSVVCCNCCTRNGNESMSCGSAHWSSLSLNLPPPGCF